MRKRPGRAESYPCPNVCGRMREVVGRADGSFVALCACEPWNGDDLPLAAADVVLLELNWSRLGRALCGALECDVRDTDLGLRGARQLGAFSPAAVPVVLSIQDDRDNFRLALDAVAARLGKPFILLAPTSGFLDAGGLEILRGARAEFFDLESNLTLMPSGLLVARKRGVELFAGLLPESRRELSDEELRRIYGQVLLTSRDAGSAREAPLKAVFDFYCVKAFSAREVSVKLDCSKATVMNRLGTLREIAGVPAKELRAYKPFFEQIEKDLTEPRARRLRRKDAAFGDDPPEAGE